MSEPKKHHYLPQFYLNNFCCNKSEKKKQIVVYNKDAEAKSFMTAIDSTGCERDYHTIDRKGEKKDRVTLEQALSKIEGQQSLLLKKMVKAKSLENVNREELAAFISIMKHRNPSMKDFIEKHNVSVIKSTMAIMQRNEKLPKPPEAVKKCMEEGKPWFEVEISNWYLLGWMFRMATDPDILFLYSRMQFSLLIAPESTFFITSDSPVSFYVPDYDRTTRPYGVGLAHKNIEVVFPLSPELAIFCSHKKRESSSVISESYVSEINRRTIVMARSHIYSHLRTSLISNLIKESCNQFAGHQIQDFDCGNGFITLSRFIPV